MTKIKSQRRRRSIAMTEALESRMMFAAISWSGSGDGASWTQAANWSPAQIPTTADDVTIASPTGTVTINGTNQLVRSLTLSNGSVLIGGFGTLNVTSGGIALSSNGTINVGNSAGTSVGFLTFSGTDITGGQSVSGTGQIIFGGSASNTITNALLKTQFFGGANPQRLTLGTGIAVTGANGRFSFNNDVSQTLRLQGSLDTFITGTTVSFTLPVTNEGVVSAASGSSIVFSSTLNNTGTILGSAASLSLPGVGTGTAAATNSTVTFTGDFTQTDLSGFTRTGGVVNISGNITGNLALTSTTGVYNLVSGGELIGGTYSATGTGKLLLRSGSTLDGVTANSDLDHTTDSFGTVTIRNGLTLNNANLLIGNSAGTTAGFVTFSGTDITGGQTLGGTGQIIFGSSTANTITNALLKTQFFGGANPQRLTIGSGVTLTGANGRVLINNDNSQTLFVQGNVNPTLVGTTFTFSLPVTNEGTFTATGGSAILFSSTLANNGAITASASNLTLPGPGTGTTSMTNGTVTFTGDFAQSDLAGFTRTGGVVNISGNITGNLALSTATGVYNLVSGGDLIGGTYSATGTGKLLLRSGSTLDGVTANSDLDHTTDSFGTVTIRNGLTLSNANLLIGNTAGTTAGFVTFSGTDLTGGQTIGGTGQIIFGGSGSNTITNALLKTQFFGGANPQRLTIGANVTVTGANGRFSLNNDNNQTVFIQGSVTPTFAGTTFTFSLPVTNAGNFTATGGSTIVFSSTLANNGTITANASNLTLPGPGTGTTSMTNGTVTFTGDFAQTDLSGFTRTGGVVNISGNITGNLALNSTTGVYNLVNGGELIGGTYSATGTGKLLLRSGSTLDGVTANSDLDHTTDSFGTVTIRNGLTLNNANLLVGNTAGTTAGFVTFSGTDVTGGQTLGGTGQIIFGGSTSNAITNALLKSQFFGGANPQRLTIGANITVTGANGRFLLNNDNNQTLVIQGNVTQTIASTSLTFSIPVTNQGTVAATGGSAVLFNNTLNNTGRITATGASLTLPGPGTGSTSMTSGTVTFTGDSVDNDLQQSDLAGFTRSGGVVNVSGDILGGLTLSAATGSYNIISGGSLVGGTYSASGGAKMVLRNNSALDGVTAASDLDITTETVTVNILNGLTLSNANLLLGSTNNSFAVFLNFSGNDIAGGQTVGGTGQIIFGGSTSNAITNSLTKSNFNTDVAAQRVTFGAGISLSGATLRFFDNGSPDQTYKLLGSLTASVNGATVGFFTPLDNQGTVAATAGRVDFSDEPINISNRTISGGRFVTSGTGRISFTASAKIDTIGSDVSIGGGPTSFTAGLATNATTVFSGTLTVASAGKLSLTGGTDLNLTSLQNAGTVSLGAGSVLTTTQSFTGQTGSALNVDIAGPAATDVGRLTSVGPVTLAGAFRGTLTGGYIPAADFTATVVTASQINGTFSSVSVGPGGGVSATVTASSVILGGAAATPPSTPVLSPTSDTGASNSDRVTSATALLLTGTADPGVTVTITADGVAVGSGVANNAGVYSITTSALASGVRVLQAIVGATPSASTISVTVDAVAPVIAPIANQSVPTGNLGGTTVALTGTVTDNLDTAPSLTFSPASGTQFPIGTTTVTATATDLAGNISTRTFNVTVFGSAFLLAPASDTGPLSTDNITSDSTPTFGGLTNAGATVNVLLDGVVIGTAVADGQGSYSITVPTVADGARVFTATSNGTQFGQISLTIDTVAPVITPPANITVTSSTSGGIPATFNGAAVDAVDPSPTLTFSITSGSVFVIGSTPVTLTATDAAGNTSTASFTVNVAPPAFTPTVGGLDAGFGNGTGVVVSTIALSQLVSLDSILLPTRETFAAGLDQASGQLILVRLNEDGTFNQAIGTGGIIRAGIPANFTARKVRLDASGVVYVLGFVTSSGQPAVLRYSQAGITDSTFGTAGVLVVPAFTSTDEINAITPVGANFLVGGTTVRGAVTAATIVRINITGAQDARFGIRGSFTRAGGALDTFNSIVIGPRGVIYAAGTTGSTASSSVLTVQLTATGRANARFVKVQAIPGQPLSSGQKVVVQSDGKVLVSVVTADGATGARAGRFGTAVIRYTTLGALDKTFAGSGIAIVTTPPVAPAAVQDAFQKEFASAAASVAAVPGGRVRQLVASPGGQNTTLTQTQIVSDALDLAVGALTIPGARAFRVNARTFATLRLSNNGSVASPTVVPVSVFLSSDQTFNPGGADPLVATVQVRLGLRAGAARAVSLPFTPTTTGNFFVIIQLGGAGDLNPANNVAVATRALVVTSNGRPVTTAAQTLDEHTELKRLFSASPVLA